MALTAKERLAAAINRVVDPTKNQSSGKANGIAPYFGAVLRGLIRREFTEEMVKFMEATGMTPTLAVSKDGVLWWSAKFVATLTADEMAAVLIHEAMHVVLKHSDRAIVQGVLPDPTVEGITRAQTWNVAADCAINQEVRKFATLPKIFGESCCYPEDYQMPAGLTAEEYFRLLQQQQQKQPKGGGKGQPKPGQGAGQGASGKPGVTQGHCGGCAQRPVPGEPAPSTSKGEGRSEAELERMRRATAEAVKEHSKTRGDVPASLQRWADELLAPPKIPWRTKLARTIRGAVAYRSGAVDFTWKKVSRRQAGVGFGLGRPIVPSLHAPLPQVGVVVDTSGSMSENDLSAALSEIQGVLSAVGANITVCVCDARVHGLKEVKTVREAAAMLAGGGGTMMAPALKAVADLKVRPSVVICMTDGYIDDPPEQPYTLIYCVVGKNPGFSPSFGEVVHVEDAA